MIIDQGMENIKIALTNGKNSKNLVVRVGIKSIYRIKDMIYKVKRILLDKEHRAIAGMKLFQSKRLQQTTAFTSMNRYPEIFTACRDYFKGREEIKILSYGCSTGEEVLTLRKYFPHATIVGADINPYNLKVCKSHQVDNKISFVKSIPKELKKHGTFDVIFCMAVLQRTPHLIQEQKITSLKKIYPFEKFEEQINELDSYLKVGGLLVVHFSQYAVEDTQVASKYESFGDYDQKDYASGVFDRKSQLITIPRSIKSIFTKVN